MSDEYPTAWAYEQACKTIEKLHAEVAQLKYRLNGDNSLNPGASGYATMREAKAADLAAQLQEAKATLETINGIRNSIVAFQNINWSEHIYPLVAALDAAGLKGMGYPEGREHFGTMLERTNAAEAKLATIERETRDEAMAAAQAAVCQTMENEDRAVSKGSAPYDRTFFVAAACSNIADSIRALGATPADAIYESLGGDAPLPSSFLAAEGHTYEVSPGLLFDKISTIAFPPRATPPKEALPWCPTCAIGHRPDMHAPEPEATPDQGATTRGNRPDRKALGRVECERRAGRA